MIKNCDFLNPMAVNMAMNHALKEYPKESCGLIIEGTYYPCENTAENPEKNFVIDPKEFVKLSALGELQAVIHSHPNGPFFPSLDDMKGQLELGVPWGIISTDGERTNYPIMWGEGVPIAPLIGREFMHGVYDCFSLLRDAFFLGKEELKKQEITNAWPFDSIKMADFPREDSWWETGKDYYTENFKKLGWKTISMEEARPGDGFLASIRGHGKLNHAGLLLEDNLILHHLPFRLSRKEPAGLWARQADLWLRYEGN